MCKREVRVEKRNMSNLIKREEKEGGKRRRERKEKEGKEREGGKGKRKRKREEGKEKMQEKECERTCSQAWERS